MNCDRNKGNLLAGLMLLLLCCYSFYVNANEMEMRRVLVGLRLFPAAIGADTNLDSKKNSQGVLPVVVLYKNKYFLAQQLAERLSQVEKIKNIPVKVEVQSFEEFISKRNSAAVAAFLAERPNSELPGILQRSISASILLFSPYKGDVEKGVHSGFVVSDRILTHVNVKTLQQSKISLKAFFLRVSRHHE